MSTGFTGSGISEEQIENFVEYADILGSLACCICLDVVKNPVECTNCESLYCEECWNLLKISNKKCVINCIAPVVKANTFVYQILNKLLIKCTSCKKGGIPYDKYILHADSCIMSLKYGTKDELSKILKEKKKLLEDLKSKLNHTNSASTLMSTYCIVEKLSKEEIRQKLITFSLTVNQKMELYNAAVEGRLNDFKSLVINHKYPLLEEVSAHNYYWTPLHYAMHYGKIDIVCFILDSLKEQGKLDLGMKLQSNDNRCPILCLLKSNALSYEIKKDYLERIFKRYSFEISPEVTKEIKNRNFDHLLKQYRS